MKKHLFQIPIILGFLVFVGFIGFLFYNLLIAVTTEPDVVSHCKPIEVTIYKDTRITDLETVIIFPGQGEICQQLPTAYCILARNDIGDCTFLDSQTANTLSKEFRIPEVE